MDCVIDCSIDCWIISLINCLIGCGLDGVNDGLIACLIDCLIECFIDCWIDSLIACLIDCFIDSLIDCLTDGSKHCLIDCLIDGLIHCLPFNSPPPPHAKSRFFLYEQVFKAGALFCSSNCGQDPRRQTGHQTRQQLASKQARANAKKMRLQMHKLWNLTLISGILVETKKTQESGAGLTCLSGGGLQPPSKNGWEKTLTVNRAPGQSARKVSWLSMG